MRETNYEDILNYIIKFKEEKGYSPVFREIADGIGKAPSTVCDYLKVMKDLGVIDYIDACPRTITVPGYQYIKTA